MSTVPSTPTATDKQAEVRKLNLEIAGLTTAKDTAKRIADEASASAQEATRRAKAAEEHLATLESTMAGSAAEIREFVAYCRNVLQTAVVAMEELGHYAKEMQKHVDDLADQITKSQTALDALREAIAKEHAGISEKRLDLDIYHKRIIEAASIHLPGQKIHI